MSNVNSLKFTGVEISGVRTKFLNNSVSPSAAGTYAYSMIPADAGYKIVSVGYEWLPTNAGDKIYVSLLKPVGVSGGANLTVEVEGPGDLYIYAQAFEGILEYFGQGSLTIT